MTDTTPNKQQPEDILPHELPIQLHVMKQKTQNHIDKRVILGKFTTIGNTLTDKRLVLNIEPRLRFSRVKLEWCDVLLPADNLLGSKVALMAYCNTLTGELTIQIPFDVPEVIMTRSYNNPNKNQHSVKRKLDFDVADPNKNQKV